MIIPDKVRISGIMSEWINEAAGLRTYIPDNYGISRARYRELLNFCLQYNDWRRQAGDIYRKNIEMVEDCARQADPAIAEYLIKSVTQGIPYEWMDVPMSRKHFYLRRRKFFFLLDKRR